ncbi:MAG: NAD(P)/FAD-dependent oxidoreductase [Phycisphaerae bacterium]|nr:NAD(P)/FAD-dependent oxidoreductase [Phycisphaerae bacterium]
MPGLGPLVDCRSWCTPANFRPIAEILLAARVEPRFASALSRAIEQRMRLSAEGSGSDDVVAVSEERTSVPDLAELLPESVLNARADRTLSTPARSVLAQLLPTMRSERSLVQQIGQETDASFIVHLGVDEEYVAGAPSDVGFAEQVVRLADLARWSGGRCAPFVPFDPRRPASLAHVREAIARGCVGVALAEPPDCHRNPQPTNARRADAATHELLKYCVAEGIPVWASCTAAPLSLVRTSAAERLRGWKAVLTRRAYRTLRICLGDVTSRAGLNVIAAAAGVNAVAEVGAMSIARLKRALKERPRLATRLVYGSGAPYASAASTSDFFTLFARNAQPPAEEEAIRCGNALRWLGLDSTATSPRAVRSVSRVAGHRFDAAHPLDCIVIGAGIAGLTAARNIAVASWAHPGHSVLVLEASDRLGGRMHTLRRDELEIPLELGAELIHRPQSDQFLGSFSLWDEIARYGFSTRKIRKLSANAVHFPAWRSSGPSLREGCGICSDPDIKLALNVIDRAAGWRTGADISGAALIAQMMASSPSASSNARDMADYLLSGTIPAPTEEMSIAGLASDKMKDQQFSAEEYHVAAGYDAVPRAIASGLDVEFNAKVVRVEWWWQPPTAGVRVHLADGQVFHARTAVCALPIGILKSGEVAFDPPLPESKRSALERIAMGRLSKIALVFQRRFWSPGLSLLSHPTASRSAGRSYFVPSFGLPSAPPILNALITRSDAAILDAAVAPHALRSMNDGIGNFQPDPVEAYIRDRVLPDLNEVFPSSGVSFDDVADWHCRTWMNDPFTRGGVAYLVHKDGTASQAMHEVRATLADHRETLPLYWAGEAVAQRTNPCSVHGAHQSGVVAAKNVRAYLALPVLN